MARMGTLTVLKASANRAAMKCEYALQAPRLPSTSLRAMSSATHSTKAESDESVKK